MAGNQQKTTIPAVPLTTPMFEEDAGAGGGLLKHLTRTWIIFFERVAKAVVSSTVCVIGWDIQDSTPGLDVSDPVIPQVAFAPTACEIRVKGPDGANNFQIDIRVNKVSIFVTKPFLAKNGAFPRTVQKFKAIKPNQQIKAADDVVIDIVQGGNWQTAVYLVGAPI